MLLSAFHKLPELFLSDYSSFKYYEAHLANIYAMAILQELNSQNIPYPLSRFTIERKYDNSENKRVDLFVNLPGELIFDPLETYGRKLDNWIEIKFFTGSGRNRNQNAKTTNVGQIINDIIRLCLFVKEAQGKHRNNGRHLLLVFNDKPKEYLAFTRQGEFEDRQWLRDLLSPGVREIDIDLTDEVDTVKDPVLKGIENLKINFKCDVHSFYPLSKGSKNTSFYGYLINIFEYSVEYKQYKIRNDAYSKENWTGERVQELRDIAKDIESNN